jgi:hypothetical protein
LTPPPAAPPPRKRLGGFWLGAIFALAGVIGGKLLIDWSSHQGMFARLGLGSDADQGPVLGPPTPSNTQGSTAAQATKPPAAPTPTATAPVAAVRPDAESPAPNAAPTPAPTVAAKPDASGTTAAPVAAGKDAEPPEPKTAVAEDDDTNEEELLKKAVPNAEQAVIGANGAEPAKTEPEAPDEKRAPAKTAAGKPSRPAPAFKPKPPAHETAILHLKTTPVGAVVRTKGQVLGRTPINLHFRTGNTYELTFVKSGYQPASRLVAVVSSKDKTLALALKKRPAAKKPVSHSFFHPHR